MRRNFDGHILVRSPWSDKKVSVRVVHNSVALLMDDGQREGDRICPVLMKAFMSLHGHLPTNCYTLCNFHQCS